MACGSYRGENSFFHFSFLRVLVSRSNGDVIRFTYQVQTKLFDHQEGNLHSRLENVQVEIDLDLSKKFYHEKHDR